MTPEEKRAKQAEYMRRWRAANPEKARETAQRHIERWNAEHPEESRSYWRKWREEHPETRERVNSTRNERAKQLRATDPEWRAEQNRRANGYYAKWSGVPEIELQARFQADHPAAVSMDRVRPDFYIPGNGFVEIKRALPFLKYGWRVTSVHFPGLYFQYSGRWRVIPTIDAQFAAQPKPLLVIVYHALTGAEITRKVLTTNAATSCTTA